MYSQNFCGFREGPIMCHVVSVILYSGHSHDVDLQLLAAVVRLLRRLQGVVRHGQASPATPRRGRVSPGPPPCGQTSPESPAPAERDQTTSTPPRCDQASPAFRRLDQTPPELGPDPSSVSCAYSTRSQATLVPRRRRGKAFSCASTA